MVGPWRFVQTAGNVYEKRWGILEVFIPSLVFLHKFNSFCKRETCTEKLKNRSQNVSLRWFQNISTILNRSIKLTFMKITEQGDLDTEKRRMRK